MTTGPNGEAIFSRTRLSETAWLLDKDKKITADLSKYIGYITNANVSISEPLQIVSYGIGGYYAVFKLNIISLI